jgi:tetratricopeptide (TPR) repeat protein
MTEKMGAKLAAVDPAELADAHVAMLKRCAETLQKYGRGAEAEDYCRLLLEHGAHKDVALHGIGVAALNVGKPEEAVSILARAIEIAPERGDIRADLAVALDAAGDSAGAERLARENVRRNPTSQPALIAMGRILTRQGRFDESTDFFARVLRSQPDEIFARIQLAKLMAAQGEIEIAQSNFNKALEFAPTSAIAHVGAAELSLRKRDWTAGWPHWGWRFGTRPGLLPRHLQTIDPKKYPASWDGAHLKRKRVFLRAERSLAEQLLFAPLLMQAQEEARYLLVECESSALPFLKGLFPKVNFAPAGSLTPEDIVDKRIQTIASLGDLAGRYRASDADFATAPKLRLAAGEAVTTQLRQEYSEALPDCRLIGLSWRGGESGLKSVLSEWVPLFDSAGIGVVAVQRGASKAELDEFVKTGRQMIVDPRQKDGMAFYAAQLSAVDAVIAVDDATANLAASLGKPVIKPVSPVDHWSWGTEHLPQLWYDSAVTIYQRPGEAAANVIERCIVATAGI